MARTVDDTTRSRQFLAWPRHVPDARRRAPTPSFGLDKRWGR
jgi:hypothetical protein